MSSTTKNASPERVRSDLAVAARENWVIWAGLFALGIGFGVLVTSHGFAWWIAPLISATMFAGSVEFILIGMLAVGAPLAAIATTTFVVNSRHLFYGLSFPLNRVNGRLAKAYSVFALCDEAYALMTAKDPETLRSRRILWTQAGLHFGGTRRLGRRSRGRDVAQGLKGARVRADGIVRRAHDGCLPVPPGHANDAPGSGLCGRGCACRAEDDAARCHVTFRSDPRRPAREQPQAPSCTVTCTWRRRSRPRSR